MKRMKIFSLLLLLPLFMLGGCNQKTFTYQNVERDVYNTGGNISFEYDEISHTAQFGGENEVVQFYEKDIAKGWLNEGCRIGIKINLPKDLKDYKSATAVLGGEKLNAEDFIAKYNEDTPQYAIFQPLVNKENKTIQLEIVWKEGYAKQIYYLVIKEGTLFMENSI